MSGRVRWSGSGLAAGALACGLCAAAAAPALAADLPDPTMTTSGSVSTFEFVSHTTDEKFVPNGGSPTTEFPKDPPKAGDSVRFTEDLTQKGTKIGSDSGTCSFSGGSAGTLTCDVTMTFAKGTFVFHGSVPFDDNKAFTVPIGSGTGAYAGARGEIRVSHINEDDDDNVIAFTTSATGPAPTVRVVPSGGASTGAGSTSGAAQPWLIGLGAVALAAGATGFGVAARSARRTG